MIRHLKSCNVFTANVKIIDTKFFAGFFHTLLRSLIQVCYTSYEFGFPSYQLVTYNYLLVVLVFYGPSNTFVGHFGRGQLTMPRRHFTST